MPRQQRDTKTKAMHFEGVGLDESDGIIEGIAAVMGVVDLVGDRINPGAFERTIAQRKSKIPMGLDHEIGFGVTLEMEEVSRADLPRATRQKYPEATGGLYAKGQVMLTDENSQHLRVIRERVQAGRPPLMSFTYHEIVSRKSQTPSGVINDLDELAVTEWGPQLTRLAVNSAAHVTSAKSLAGSQEEKRELLSGMLKGLGQFSGADWIYIEGTFDDHLVARVEAKNGPHSFWRVGYGMVDGELRLGEATEVELATVVLQKSVSAATLALFVDDCAARVKAGRVLSQKNLDALQSAIEQLQKIFEAATSTADTAAQGKSMSRDDEDSDPAEGTGEGAAAAPLSAIDFDLRAAELEMELLELQAGLAATGS